MFQIVMKVSRAIDGKRNLPGISQATSRGMASLTVKSRTGTLARFLMKGFSSEKPRYMARTVRVRSNWLRRIKEAFSAVHLLNVAAESHKLAFIPIPNRPVKRY